MMINSTKCIIFSRVSTSSQSLESQNDVLYRYATKEGYCKNEIKLIEQTESAVLNDIDNRIGIQQLFRLIEETPSIKCVIVFEISRIARRPDVLYKVRDYLLERKIQLICIKPEIRLLDETGNFSQSANMIFSIFSSLAESEGYIRKERFARAKNKLRNEGKKFAGAVVFGYMKLEDKSIGLHPLYSKIISEIFNYYATNELSSASKTYEWCVAHYPAVFPILPYTKAKRRILALLSNTKYWLGDWCYPAIISKELGERVQEKLHKGRCMPRFNTKFDYFGRGLLICKHCGHILTPAAGKTFAYVCPTDKLHSITININIIEQLIWRETNVLANLNASLSNSERITEIHSSIVEKENLISNNKERLNALDDKYNRLVTIFVDGKIPQQVFDKQNESIQTDIMAVKESISALNASVNELKALLNSSQDILNPKSINFDTLEDFETKLQLVHQYIDKIYIEKLENRVYLIEFTYKPGIYIIQRGLYKYVCKNQNNKKVYRMNEDGTEDELVSL